MDYISTSVRLLLILSLCKDCFASNVRLAVTKDLSEDANEIIVGVKVYNPPEKIALSLYFNNTKVAMAFKDGNTISAKVMVSSSFSVRLSMNRTESRVESNFSSTSFVLRNITTEDNYLRMRATVSCNNSFSDCEHFDASENGTGTTDEGQVVKLLCRSGKETETVTARCRNNSTWIVIDQREDKSQLPQIIGASFAVFLLVAASTTIVCAVKQRHKAKLKMEQLTKAENPAMSLSVLMTSLHCDQSPKRQGNHKCCGKNEFEATSHA